MNQNTSLGPVKIVKQELSDYYSGKPFFYLVTEKQSYGPFDSEEEASLYALIQLGV